MYLCMHDHTHNSIQFGAHFPSPSTKEMALTTKDRPKIVFFDLETTGSKPDPVIIIEFGAILLCPNTLLELRRYSKLVRPADDMLSLRPQKWYQQGRRRFCQNFCRDSRRGLRASPWYVITFVRD